MTFLSDRTIEHLRRVVDRPAVAGGRYEILEELGHGGMSTVYLAHDRALGRAVALKVLATAIDSADARERMVREAQIVARLEHPGIVPVHDVGTLADGRVFYAMKRVGGERLDEHLRRTGGLGERLRIFERICEAVSFAHAHGVIHRDLKPGNVMVGPFGEVLVLDWGVAKILAAGEPGDDAPEPAAVPRADDPDAPTLPLPGPLATSPGTVVGTPGYMAPEQASGRPDLVDARSDVYALGAVLRDLLAGTKASRRLAAIRDRALAADPAGRYARVDDLADDVRRFLDGRSVSAYRETALDRAARFVERYKAPILLVLAYLVMRLLVLALAGA